MLHDAKSGLDNVTNLFLAAFQRVASLRIQRHRTHNKKPIRASTTMAVSRASLTSCPTCKGTQDFETTEIRLFPAGKHGHRAPACRSCSPWAGLSPDITPWCDIVIVVVLTGMSAGRPEPTCHRRRQFEAAWHSFRRRSPTQPKNTCRVKFDGQIQRLPRRLTMARSAGQSFVDIYYRLLVLFGKNFSFIYAARPPLQTRIRQEPLRKMSCILPNCMSIH